MPPPDMPSWQWHVRRVRDEANPRNVPLGRNSGGCAYDGSCYCRRIGDPSNDR